MRFHSSFLPHFGFTFSLAMRARLKLHWKLTNARLVSQNEVCHWNYQIDIKSWLSSSRNLVYLLAESPEQVVEVVERQLLQVSELPTLHSHLQALQDKSLCKLEGTVSSRSSLKRRHKLSTFDFVPLFNNLLMINDVSTLACFTQLKTSFTFNSPERVLDCERSSVESVGFCFRSLFVSSLTKIF